jgi:hypothetical protein
MPKNGPQCRKIDLHERDSQDALRKGYGLSTETIYVSMVCQYMCTLLVRISGSNVSPPRKRVQSHSPRKRVENECHRTCFLTSATVPDTITIESCF